jgi:hypothetical protein
LGLLRRGGGLLHLRAAHLPLRGVLLHRALLLLLLLLLLLWLLLLLLLLLWLHGILPRRHVTLPRVLEGLLRRGPQCA